jgi:pSer/pThr/pTyr-binding forkhead associated (FHA) protein
VPSPFFGADAAPGEDENDDDDEAEGGADDADPPPADDVEPPAEAEASAEDEDRPTTGETAAPPPAQDDEPPHEPENADRTAIVRPSGRKLWIQREGHETLELSGMRLTVGRDPRCEIVIASPRVSREHAAILVDEDTVLVTDLNSSNGTFFNGERIMKHVVNDGDTVQFGNEKVTFRFSDPG